MAQMAAGYSMSGMASYTPGMEISGGSLGHGLTVAEWRSACATATTPGCTNLLGRRTERRLHLEAAQVCAHGMA